jgi:hypothetical protein
MTAGIGVDTYAGAIDSLRVGEGVGMKSINPRLLVALVAVACTGMADEKNPQGMNGAIEVLTKAFENLYGDDYIQTLDLVVDAPGSRSVAKKLQVIRRQRTKPGKAIIRFLEPYDIRHTSVLVLQNPGAFDDLYVYLPASRMTRRISSAQRADAFFGTDLSYEDIEPKTADDYVATYSQADGGEKDCDRLEVIPRESGQSTYDLMVLCIERATYLILEADYHKNGGIIKQLDVDVSEVRLISGRYIPFVMTMRTLRTGSETKIHTRQYQLVREIPESIFSTRNLETGDAAADRARVVAAD